MALFTSQPGFAGRTLAIDEAGGTASYGDLDALAARYEEAAGGRGLCAVLCENRLGIVLGYLACLRSGLTPLMVDAHVDPGLLSHLLEAYRPGWLLLPDDVDGATEQVLGPREGAVTAFGCTLARRTGVEGPALHPDLALLLTTSGSTGSPKLVRQSRTNLECNARSIAQYLELTETERPITTLPLSYTYGLSILHSHVLVGATMLLTRRGVVERPFWDFFRREGATSLAGVPYTYQMFRRLKLTQMDLPSLRYCTQAGGKLNEDLHALFAQWASDTGRRFFVMYGQTEATARMGYLPWQRAVEKRGSMGIPIPGGSFTLEGADGAPIDAPDTVGELVYTGPNVAMGYAHGAADLALGDQWGGVLRTGDMARRDSQGFYYIVGRKKRFVKLFGSRVSLDELERLLAGRFPGVEFACTGRDDLVGVFAAGGDEALPNQAAEYLSQVTRQPYRAFQVKPIPAIPKNEAGKTIYGNLKLEEE